MCRKRASDYTSSVLPLSSHIFPKDWAGNFSSCQLHFYSDTGKHSHPLQVVPAQKWSLQVCRHLSRMVAPFTPLINSVGSTHYLVDAQPQACGKTYGATWYFQHSGTPSTLRMHSLTYILLSGLLSVGSSWHPGSVQIINEWMQPVVWKLICEDDLGTNPFGGMNLSGENLQ